MRADRLTDFATSDTAQARLRDLLEANRNGTLDSDERAELDEASQINHFVTLLKAKAHQTLAAKEKSKG